MQKLKILTFNIAHGRGLSLYQGLSSPRRIRSNLLRIAELLDEADADIVALQEIDESSHWNGNFNHLSFLQEHTAYKHSAFGVNTRRTGRFNLSYGNGVLSKYPILSWENQTFGQAQIGEKGFLFTEIQVAGGVVPLLNLHLDYRSRLNRLRQIDRIMEFVTSKHVLRQSEWLVPPVVCGDLNNPHHRPDATASLLEYFCRHGLYSLHPQTECTFPSPWPRRTLDFVFLPPSCQQARCRVIRSFLSDHRPVTVEFMVPAHHLLNGEGEAELESEPASQRD